MKKILLKLWFIAMSAVCAGAVFAHSEVALLIGFFGTSGGVFAYLIVDNIEYRRRIEAEHQKDATAFLQAAQRLGEFPAGLIASPVSPEVEHREVHARLAACTPDIVVEHNDSGHGFMATCSKFPAITAYGHTENEAYTRLEEALRAMFSQELKRG